MLKKPLTLTHNSFLKGLPWLSATTNIANLMPIITNSRMSRPMRLKLLLCFGNKNAWQCSIDLTGFMNVFRYWETIMQPSVTKCRKWIQNRNGITSSNIMTNFTKSSYFITKNCWNGARTFCCDWIERAAIATKTSPRWGGRLVATISRTSWKVTILRYSFKSLQEEMQHMEQNGNQGGSGGVPP